MHIPLVVYICLSLVVGLVGSNRKAGFWGYFFASIALTPLLGVLLVLLSDPRRPGQGF